MTTTKVFDPAEARDDAGKWTSGGGTATAVAGDEVDAAIQKAGGREMHPSEVDGNKGYLTRSGKLWQIDNSHPAVAANVYSQLGREANRDLGMAESLGNDFGTIRFWGQSSSLMLESHSNPTQAQWDSIEDMVLQGYPFNPPSVTWDGYKPDSSRLYTVHEDSLTEARDALAAQGVVRKTFDPNQERDDHGRWVAGGLAGGDGLSPNLHASVNHAEDIGAISKEDAQWFRENYGKDSAERQASYREELAQEIDLRERAIAPLPDSVANFKSDLHGALANNEDYAQEREPEEESALLNYKGEGFYNINHLLRTGESINPAFRGLTEEQGRARLERQVANIDSAMKTSTIDAPLQVERGLSFDRGSPEEQDWNNLKPGSTITDPAFMSTTTKTDDPMFGGKGTWTGTAYHLTIQVPEGTHGIAMDRYGTSGPGHTNDEGEILLDRGTTLKVHRVEQVNNGRVKNILASVV